MANKEVVAFKNKATGKVWAVNPGTAAHKRMEKGLTSGDYELVQLDKPATKSRSRTKQSSADGE